MAHVSKKKVMTFMQILSLTNISMSVVNVADINTWFPQAPCYDVIMTGQVQEQHCQNTI